MTVTNSTPHGIIIKEAGRIGSLTLISRILGYLRDAAIAGLLGAGFYSDIFFAAFRIPNLFRKLLSDGALSISFIPVFTRIKMERGDEEAFDMVRSSFIIVFLAGSIAVIAGSIAAPAIVKLIAPGFIDNFEKFSATVNLTKIMMPYLLFVALMAICMGTLNAMGHFFAPSAAPIILNLSILFFAGCVSSSIISPPGASLAIGVTVGGFLQLALHWPFLISNGFKVFKKNIRFHQGSIQALKRMFPAMTGLSAYQVNLLTGTFLASTLDQGSISYLYYADRLIQFPLGVFTVSVTTVLFPELSKKVIAGDMDEISELFLRGIKFIFFITIPSLAGLVALKKHIVTLLFSQGAFDLKAVNGTCSVLLFFSLGLWALSGTRLLVSLFHAFSDMRTPFKAGIISMTTNIFFSWVLMGFMGVKGISIGICAASMVNFTLLLMEAVRYLNTSCLKEIIYSACRSVFFSGIMFSVVKWVEIFICPSGEYGKVLLFGSLTICILTGVFVYAGLGLLFKTPEIKFMIKLVKKN